MKVKAKMKLLYAGEIYKAGECFEMDECTAAISAKYNRIEILDGAAEDSVDDELEPVDGLPPVQPLKKKK